MAWCQLDPAEPCARGCFPQNPILKEPQDFVAASSLSSSCCGQSSCSWESTAITACCRHVTPPSSHPPAPAFPLGDLDCRQSSLRKQQPLPLDNISVSSIPNVQKCAASVFPLLFLAARSSRLSKVFPAAAGREIPWLSGRLPADRRWTAVLRSSCGLCSAASALRVALDEALLSDTCHRNHVLS